MSDIDTSAETVKALINRHRLVASTWRMTVSDHEQTAATLCALLAERDRLRDALGGVAKGVAHGPRCHAIARAALKKVEHD